jgi:hypothetical protein
MHALQSKCRRVGFDPVHEKEQRMRSMQVNELEAEDATTMAMEQDPSIEAWLRNEVVPAALELKANPSQALSVEEVLAHLAEERRHLG